MSYYRSTYGGGQYYRPSFFGGFRFFPPVIKVLLISNTLIWLLTDFLPFTVNGIPVAAIVMRYFALWPFGENFWPWQLGTYLFLHGGFGHLFFNMLALWMFGMELENLWGARRFVTYYLVCGLGAGIANLLVPLFIGAGGPTVGASGAVFGVLVAFGMLFPDRPIYIYFLLPIKAKFFVAAYIALELFYGVFGMNTGVAHFAHLGGAAVGFVITFMTMRGRTLVSLWEKLTGVTGHRYRTHRARHVSDDEVFEAKFYDIRTGRPFESDNEMTQEVIDAILDKINTSGYQSLTEEEKRILSEASRKIH